MNLIPEDQVDYYAPGEAVRLVGTRVRVLATYTGRSILHYVNEYEFIIVPEFSVPWLGFEGYHEELSVERITLPEYNPTSEY